MSNYDSAWKEAVGQFFQPFLEFFFPELAIQVDWEKGYSLLDKELQKFAPRSKGRKRHADILVSLTLLSGELLLALVHVEVQSQVDETLPERLLEYHVRIRDYYRTGQVATLVILGDGKPDWRPTGYANEFWGCNLKLEVPIRKLLDFPDTPTIPSNPFSWLVAAQRKSLGARRKVQARFEAKWQLVRGLYKANLTSQQIRDFFRLMDWVLDLPKHLEYNLETRLKKLEDESAMVHLTSIERIILKRERAEGLRDGKAEVARRMLAKGIDSSQVAELTDLPLEEVRNLKPAT